MARICCFGRSRGGREKKKSEGDLEGNRPFVGADVTRRMPGPGEMVARMDNHLDLNEDASGHPTKTKAIRRGGALPPSIAPGFDCHHYHMFRTISKGSELRERNGWIYRKRMGSGRVSQGGQRNRRDQKPRADEKSVGYGCSGPIRLELQMDA